ncbi:MULTISPECIES: protein kinase [unclassified Streptomyces]|uniref:protein kinase domain-containing protein n=1 Tax=unclassified Streptomyces TaxID=2593676 RepID=UPI00278C8639|nr:MULTISPECIES: protein kinase [unclassified Streptomyces]
MGPWNTGDVIDGLYQLTRLVGHGGMGVVHRVRHLGWGIDLAVKSPLPRHVAHPADAERFVAEAQTWVSLGLHPNVCSCYYVRVLDGVPRLFAEYVRGGSLRESIDSGALYAGDPATVVARLVRIGCQLARGLEFAHDSGVLHRDVKPANVLLDSGVDGVAKITDFGIAQALSTGPGGPSGGGLTPAYASPEQLRGNGPLGRASDVYSFAVSVREMFGAAASARSATTATTVGTVGAVTRATYDSHPATGPVEPSEEPARRYMPEALAHLLDRCLTEDPRSRPDSMADIAGELEDIHARLDPAAPRLVPPTRAELRAAEYNNRALSLLDLGEQERAADLLRKALEADPQHLDATYNAGLIGWRRGETTDVALLSALRVAGRHAGDPWHARVLTAQAHLERGAVDSARGLLERVAHEHADEPETRAATEALDSPRLGHLSATSTTRLPWYPDRTLPPFGQVAFTRDGTHVISGESTGTTRLWDAATGQCLRGCENPGTRSIDVSSVDGTFGLTLARGECVRLWNFETGRSLRMYTPVGDESVQALRLSPDQTTAYAVTRDGELLGWNLQRGTETPRGALVLRERFDERAVFAMAEVSPDGSTLLVHRGDPEGRLRLVCPGSPDRSRLLTDSCARVSAMAWSADGARVVVASDDAAIRVWNVRTGACERSLTTVTGITSLALDDDTRWALTGNEDGTVCLWDLAESRCVRTLEGHTAGVCDVWLSPDGRHARSVAADDTVRSWEFRVPVGYVAALRVSRPHPVVDLTHFGDRARELTVRAETAVAATRYRAAHQLLVEARALPGYERDVRLLRAWRELADRFPRTGLRTAWITRTMSVPGTSLRRVRTSVCDDGRYATCGTLLGANVWDLRAGVPLFDLDDGVLATRLDAGGDRVAAVMVSGTMRVWSTSERAPLATVVPEEPRILTTAAVSADLGQALTADTAHELRLWDLAGAGPPRTLTGHTSSVSAVSLSADGRTAVSGAADSLRLWDLPSGRCLLDIPADDTYGPHDVRVSKDRRTVVACGFDEPYLRMWNGAGERLHAFAGQAGLPDRVVCLALSADDRFVFAGDMAGTVTVWSVRTGDLVHTLETGRSGVLDLRMTPDGRHLLVGGFDGTASLWELDWEFTVPDS